MPRLRSRRLRHVAVAAAGALALTACVAGAARPGDDAYAQRLVTLVNDYRAHQSAGPLVVDPALARLAREHSAAMARAGKLSHDGFAGRAERSGYAICVENVGWNYPTPADQLDGWRHSPGHDRNLVDRRVDRVGIAVAGGYATMLACGR